MASKVHDGKSVHNGEVSSTFKSSSFEQTMLKSTLEEKTGSKKTTVPYRRYRNVRKISRERTVLQSCFESWEINYLPDSYGPHLLHHTTNSPSFIIEWTWSYFYQCNRYTDWTAIHYAGMIKMQREQLYIKTNLSFSAQQYTSAGKPQARYPDSLCPALGAMDPSVSLPSGLCIIST